MPSEWGDLTRMNIDVLLKGYEHEAGVVADDDCSSERQGEAKRRLQLFRTEIKRRIRS